MLSHLLFVTGNADKLREAQEILGIDIKQAHAELLEIQTINVEDLIIHKAEQAYGQIKAPLIVEDSGLVFTAWNGLPGALVKWFEKSVGNNGLVRMLEPELDRRAVAQCFIALHSGSSVTVVKGELNGHIADYPRGENGFGWDKIFIPHGHRRTFAEMSPEEKNAISHRRIAFEHLKKTIATQ